MILVIAALIWLLALGLVTFAPRWSATTRREAQYDLLAFGLLGALTAGFF